MTHSESQRLNRMLDLGCSACRLELLMTPAWRMQRPEVHHVLSGGRRMGHAFTLPLCVGHHRGVWPSKDLRRPSIASGRNGFRKRYGEERTLWIKVQRDLGLSEEWPVSKVVHHDH